MIKTNEKRHSPPTRMFSSVRNLFADVLTLAELQLQLFKADLDDGRTHMVRGIILLASGATLLLASLPVAVLAGGYAIVAQFDLPMWAGLLISSAIGFVIGGLMLWGSSRMLTRSVGFFKRSTDELARNVKWVRSAASSQRS